MTQPAPETNTPRYNAVAKFLHWTIALAIIAMLALGWTMMNVAPTNSYKFPMFQWHKSLGITILALSLVRLVWRLTHRAPALPVEMKTWEKFAAHAAHWLFYVFMIGMPLTGWVIVSTSPLNIPTMLYGFLPLPHLPVPVDMEARHTLGHNAGAIHGLSAYILAALIVMHIGAAWKHHLFNRDDVLLRMAPNFMHGILKCLRGQAAALIVMIAAGAFLAPGTLWAKSWTVDYTASHLGFTGKQGDASFDGGFKKFQVAIDLDPAHPETGSIKADIDVSSITAGSSERDEYLPQPDWFDSKKFPAANFTSSKIASVAGPDGAQCFKADGTLTIKGIAKPVALPFCLTVEGDHTRAKGRITLVRSDYKIGEGSWSNENYVKFGVDVNVDIAAK